MAASGPRRLLRQERTYADETPLATSFRVYTPLEIRTSRLRPSLVPLPVEEKMTPEMLVRAIAIGVGALVAAFVAFLVIGNLTDDTANVTPSGLAQARFVVRAPSAPPPAAPVVAPVEARVLPMLVIGDPPTDFELPDDAPVRVATKAKKRKKPRTP